MYDKTSSGQKEIASNATGLSMMERRVLILINGEHGVDDVAKLSLCDDIDAVVNRLLELELIEAIDPASSIDPTEPNVFEADVPAEAAAETIPGDVNTVGAREFMCNTLQTFGNRMRIADLHQQIAQTTDLDTLKQLIKPWYQAISDTPGGMYQADDLRKEVLDMVHREEVNAA